MTARPLVIVCPLHVFVGRTRVTLNLNRYRNLHHQVNNRAKVAFKSEVLLQVVRLPFFKRASIEYTLYPGTKRICDVANVCCIVDKFLSDVLTLTGKIADDDYRSLPMVTYRFGDIDKNNPRVEARITELENTNADYRQY